MTAPIREALLEFDIAILFLMAIALIAVSGLALWQWRLRRKNLQKMQPSIDELNYAKDVFASLASHQLRAPATAVKNFLDLLATYSGPLTAQQREYVKLANQSNERLLKVVDDLVRIVQLETKRHDIEVKDTDLVDTVMSQIEKYEEAAKKRHLKIETILPTECIVQGDPALLAVAVAALISNAVKFTPEGGEATVKLRRRENSAVLTVTDTGVGIGKNDTEHVFDKFTRLENELGTAGGGPGLGLYLVKTIVEHHHGRVRVYSRLGEGSQFEITLPLKQPSSAA